MMDWLLKTMGISLILTIFLEELFAYLYHIRNHKDLLLICFVNIITNPTAVFGYYMLVNYSPIHYVIVLLLLESAVILVEFHYFKKYGRDIYPPFCFAVYINLFSFCTGKVLNLIM